MQSQLLCILYLISFSLSLALYLLSPFSISHLLSLLSLILSPFIFLSPLLPSFFQSFHLLFSHLCPLYPSPFLVYCASFFTFSPPPSYLLFSLVFILIPCFLSCSSSMSNILFLSFILSLLSLCLILFTYLSLFLQACFSVNRSALGLFTYSLSLLPQRYTNPLLSLRIV